MKKIVIFKWIISLCFGLALGAECPEKTGYFPHERQCDKYYECQNGVATEHLCPDGLVFSLKGSSNHIRCKLPYEVDCSTRPDLQPPRNATDECPRLNGLFPDINSCKGFWNCIEGKGTRSECPEPLVFNIDQGNCDWPKNVDDCKEEKKDVRAIENSQCPNRFGVFPDKNDCRTYWTCVDGVGRKANCPDGLGFNTRRLACDWPDSVDNCDLEKYLGFNCPHNTELAQGTNLYFPFPDDCRKHYACIKGSGEKLILRLLTCEYGMVFDLKTEKCTSPKKVEGCEDYYDTSTTAPKRKQVKPREETSG